MEASESDEDANEITFDEVKTQEFTLGDRVDHESSGLLGPGGWGWVVIDDLLDFQGAKCYVHTLIALADMHPHLHPHLHSSFGHDAWVICVLVLVDCLVNEFLIVFL